MKKEVYPEGHYIGLGLVIGIPVGIPVGLAIGNFGLGPAIGIVLGLAIGSAMEKKAKEEGRIRPLTKKEKATKRRNMWILLGLGVLGFVVGLISYLLIR